MRHDPQILIDLFNGLFEGNEATRLVRGAAEPYYRPRQSAPDAPYAQVAFAHGFFASALHEIAHWSIAGAARRLLPDYGYWYKPDGRSTDEQRLFESVEVKPQALEWVFSVAAGAPFHFSADNLASGGAVTGEAWLRFQTAVAAQARRYADGALPPRGARFAQALSDHFATGDAWRQATAYQL